MCIYIFRSRAGYIYLMMYQINCVYSYDLFTQIDISQNPLSIDVDPGLHRITLGSHELCEFAGVGPRLLHRSSTGPSKQERGA